MLNESTEVALYFAFSLNFLVFVLVLFYSYKVKRFPIYHPVFMISAYHFLGFVARPIMIVSDGYSFVWNRTGVFPDDYTIYLTGLLSSLGYLTLTTGSILASATKGTRTTFLPISISSRNPARFAILATVLVFLGLLGNYYAYGGAGMESVQAFQTEYDEAGGQKLVGVSGYVLAMADFLPILCVLLFCNKRTRTLSLVLTTAYIGLRFYAGAQRLSFVVVLIGIGAVYLINKNKKFPPLIFILIALVTLLIFDMIGSDRFVFRRILIDGAPVSEIWDSYKQNKLEKPAGGGDLAEFDVASSALTVIPDQSGWSYGTQYLRLLIWPIPRQLWEAKPVYTSIVNLNDYGFFLAMTHTLYVDAYMVLGLFLYVPILGGFGLFVGWLFRKAASTTSVMFFMAFIIQLIYLKTLLRDGGVTVFYFLLISLACVYALKHFGGLHLIRSKNEN